MRQIASSLVVIGEAVKHLSDDVRNAVPDVPWQDVAGLRDMLAHEYFRIELDRVIEIAERDVPQLQAAVSRLLAERS